MKLSIKQLKSLIKEEVDTVPPSSPKRKSPSPPCSQDALCNRKHGWCDMCQKWRHEVKAIGRDSNGDPDAPDACMLCINAMRTNPNKFARQQQRMWQKNYAKKQAMMKK